MNKDQLVVWNDFLPGGRDVAGLTSGLQQITDKVAKDPSVTKQKVSEWRRPSSHRRDVD